MNPCVKLVIAGLGIIALSYPACAEASTLVIEKVLVNKTPQSGTWLYCLQANGATDRNVFHIPHREYEGDGITIPMNLVIPNVAEGEDINFRMGLDDDEADVCSPQAEDQHTGSFSATSNGSKVFDAGDDWSYSVYWHLEN